MRILIICSHFNPGGITRYCLTLAKGLKDRNHEVWVASSAGQWVYKLNDYNIEHKTIPLKTKSICSFKIIISLIKLIPFLRKRKIKIVHANTRVSQYLALLIYKLLKIPYVSTFHGFHKKTIMRKLLKLEGLRTIAISEAVKNHLTQDFGINPANIRTVYNGIDRQEFSVRQKNKIDYGFTETDFVVGIVGRISEEKGHFIAAEALKLISFEHNNVYLAVCGTGKLEEELRLFIKVAGIENRVRFFELESREFFDLPDILVVPSKQEGFGYAIVEAFMKGVPVIGFNTGGISEIIKDGHNGLLFYRYDSFSLKQKIEQLMKDRQLAARLSKNAKIDVNAFSMEKMAELTQKVYAEAVK